MVAVGALNSAETARRFPESERQRRVPTYFLPSKSKQPAVIACHCAVAVAL